MRLAAKWRTSWSIHANGIDDGSDRIGSIRQRVGRCRACRIAASRSCSCRALPEAGNCSCRWLRCWPGILTVVVPALRGDRSPWSDGVTIPTRGHDLGEYAQDLAFLHRSSWARVPCGPGSLVRWGDRPRIAPTLFPIESAHSLSTASKLGSIRRIGSSIARRALERFPLPRDNPFINQFFHLLYGAKPEPGPLVDFVVDRIWETDQSVMAQRLAQAGIL